MTDDTRIRQDLMNLLRFSAALQATRDTAVFDIADHPIHLTGRDLLDRHGAPLPGIAFGPGEDSWFSFARLRAQPPPPVPALLAPWLRADPRPTPDQPPVLLAGRVVEVQAEPVQPEVVAALAGYVAGPWRDWAAAEAPRRAAIDLYETLYKAQAQIAASGGEAGLELVVGIGLASWSRPPHHLNVPLIEQRAEFELDAATGMLAIVPRDVPPVAVLRPFLDMAIPGAAELQHDLTVQLEAIARDPDLTFGPFQPASFRPVLQACAARLDASGVLLAAEDAPGPAGEALRISPGFCILVRPRREDILRDDITRLAEAVALPANALPQTARRFVEPLADLAPDDGAALDLTRLGAAGGEAARRPPEWLFFPLPANAEQAEIARRLEQNDVHGVVVQGPPGTGKTHTIANIIGHSMAMGRRVLVSAHTAEALSAIRDKLPAALRNLVIAVTHSDREGARQLEEAVSALADRVQALNPAETRRQATELLLAIQRDDARLAAIEAELQAVARANLTELPWRGVPTLPQAIAAWRAAQGERHGWFTDRLDLIAAHEPKFTEADLAQARLLRRQLGPDLRYRADDLPAGAAGLPTLSAVVAAHRTLRGVEARRRQEVEGNLPRPDLAAAAPGEAVDLLAWLDRLAAWRGACREHRWLPAAWRALASGRPMGRLHGQTLRPLLQEATRLAERGEALGLQALELAEVAQAGRLGAALAKLAAGGKPFGRFGGFGNGAVKQALEAARVAAAPPRGAADWGKLWELHVWRGAVPGFIARWNALAAQHGLTRLPVGPALEPLYGLGRSAGDMLALLTEARSRAERLRVIFPYGLEVEEAVLRADVALVAAALRASLGDPKQAEADRTRAALRTAAERSGGPLGAVLRQMADGLGAAAADDATVAEGWRAVQAEAERLAGQRNPMRRLARIAAMVRQSGAPRWAARIAREPPDVEDTLLPADWQDAWDWSRAGGLLARIANRAAVQRLTAEQARIVAVRERRLLEVIEHMTYLGLRRHMTDSVQAALRQFLAALARLPKTAGAKTAPRQRRILRDALQRCARAVPCWIMPEWRVAEQLPPELGSFDLVVIDEASQSNIMALPVVLRGRKLLIVGDDRQVSPSAVGIEDAAVNRLRATYLRGQPLAEQIDPATSLYELAGMMYPARVVMLREHFRCVEPIIRFSSRFYGGRLLALRLPKPSERLDPPLVDILVEHGCRCGDVNVAEAEMIVAEIKAIMADPALNAAGKRSIGVISLHADKQARLITDRLLQAVGPEAMGAHRVMCGDAATFQGQERDIVFLSMVHDRVTATKQSSRRYEQRYNVALSRARDRMVLVRSVTAADLSEGDIKLEVLRHFQTPLDSGRTDDVLAACESAFERQVGARLIAAGYRVRAQVPAGGSRIDFVVEGEGDRRLAIALDGDTLHGPERWAAEVTRQQALERVGWSFWRCWASEWVADSDTVFADLLRTLDQHGIAARHLCTHPPLRSRPPRDTDETIPARMQGRHGSP